MPLTAIHMCRKPLSGNVASTAIKYGTGSLNIDATRLGNSGGTARVGKASLPTPQGWANMGGHGSRSLPKGRWPANVILMHKPGCRLEKDLANVYSGENEGGNYDGHKGGSEDPDYVDANAQMVGGWGCVDMCPVRDLEGTLTSRSGPYQPVNSSNWNSKPFDDAKGWNQHSMCGSGQKAPAGYGDSGGASRYYKQVGSESNLLEYLLTMISTPDKRAILINLDQWPSDITEWEKGSVVGLVAYGTAPITESQVAETLRVLPPGGHLVLIAPDKQPTGHTGAVIAEDGGFEIRDCILLVKDIAPFHYVPKPSRKEKEAGCWDLPPRKGHEVVNRKEGSPGIRNPAEGAGGLAKETHNPHPTVKAIALMERLLSDIPKDEGPVLDPFMGSGTTGIACSKTGHSFIGIEQDEEYLAIADARVRYWDRAFEGWKGADIISEYKPPEEKPKSLGLFDFLK